VQRILNPQRLRFGLNNTLCPGAFLLGFSAPSIFKMHLPKYKSVGIRHGLGQKGLVLFLLFFALIFSAQTSNAQTVSGSSDLVISQIYTRGGEPGAALRNDFVEFFNRSNHNVNLADYSLVISGAGLLGTTDVTISFVSSSGIIVVPGQYILFQLGSSGNNGGVPIVSPEFTDATINLNNTSGKIALVQTKSGAPLGCPLGQDAAIDDYVGYGPASCAEGAAPVAAPPTANLALIRRFGGCGDTDNNAADFTTGGPSPRNEFSLPQACTPVSPANTIQFDFAHVDVDEGQGFVDVFVSRSGDISAPATVQYATVSNQPTRQPGQATDRGDYTTALGTLRMAAGERRKSFPILITDDVYLDGLQSLTVRLESPTGVALGALNAMTIGIVDNDSQSQSPNPIDSTNFFVRQQYADFLGRVPDLSGFAFWANQIDSCINDTDCQTIRRINVSAAFYLSIEFQENGFFVYRLFRASYVDNVSRPRGFPTYREFIHDTQDIGRGVVVGQGNWQAQLEANKQLAVNEFVQRPEFKLAYTATLTSAQFVDALNANTGGALSVAERDALVTGLQNGTETRATVLRRVADDDDFRNAQFNRAFVLMEYFGYLRRNPTEAPDTDFSGFDFWLAKLTLFNGNFVQSQMVQAFLDSSEYRARFGSN
jgi:hypothetical protein